MTTTTEIRTASAREHPCQMYRYHRPIPTRTQFHHSFPVYLQNRIFDKIVFGPDFWVCGTCHDSIHAWIDWRLGEARKPNPEPGRRVKAKAEEAVKTYRDYEAAKKS